MSVGYELTKALVDGRAGTLANRLEDVLRKCHEFDAWLDGVVNTQLTDPGDPTTPGTLDPGYSDGEVAVLKSAFSDAAELYAVYQGLQAVASPKDFRTFLRTVQGP